MSATAAVADVCTGLQTLQREGLDLSAMEVAGSSCAELLEWHPADRTKPDAEQTVLIWTRDGAGNYDWSSGWWDGEVWRYCESGGVVGEDVERWAQPEGPAC